MGCWNKTCGLTNLPIMRGEDTYVFVLQRLKEVHDHCYATNIYKPLLLPFVSTYNDYGGGENSRGAAFSVVMAGIKQCLVEIPVGENKYHDIAVSKDAWSEELFFEASHEQLLRIHCNGEQDLDFVMMRKEVVDDLINSYEFEQYVGKNKGTSGYHNSYVRYTMADVIADVDAFLDAMVRIQKERGWEWPRMDMLSFEYLNDPDIKNHAATWCRNDPSYRYCNVVQVRDHILELLLGGKRDLARDLMVEHLKAKFVDIFMENTRKTWIPGGYEGSQSQEYEPYRALIAVMNKVMDKRDALYAEEYGENEE